VHEPQGNVIVVSAFVLEFALSAHPNLIAPECALVNCENACPKLRASDLSCMGDDRPYRKNVGIVVFNSQGFVLAGERSDRPGAFQLPQGGLDEGESPEAAARRELLEETSLDFRGPVAFEFLNWLSYDFPPEAPENLKKYRGQKQRWFFFFWDGDVDSLNLASSCGEFSRLAWKDLGDLVKGIADFKKPVYQILHDTGRNFIRQHLAERDKRANASA